MSTDQAHMSLYDAFDFGAMERRESSMSAGSMEYGSDMSSDSSFTSMPATPVRHENADAYTFWLNSSSTSSPYTSSEGHAMHPTLDMSCVNVRPDSEGAWPSSTSWGLQQWDQTSSGLPTTNAHQPQSLQIQLAYQELPEYQGFPTDTIVPSMTGGPIFQPYTEPTREQSSSIPFGHRAEFHGLTNDFETFVRLDSARVRSSRRARARQPMAGAIAKRVRPSKNVSVVGTSRTGSHICQAKDCGKPFARQEHLKRHQRTHDESCKRFSCALQLIFDPGVCRLMANRTDNRTQHHTTHCKGTSKSRNVLVEPEVMIQAIKRMPCSEEKCLRDPHGCRDANHSPNSYVRSMLGFLVSNDLTPHRENLWLDPEERARVGYDKQEWRPTRGISNKHHIGHDKMKELGFPACLKDLSNLTFEKNGEQIRRFRYASWRTDENGCLWVTELAKNGMDKMPERRLCGNIEAVALRAHVSCSSSPV